VLTVAFRSRTRDPADIVGVEPDRQPDDRDRTVRRSGVGRRAGDPGGLSPELSHDGESTIDPARLQQLVIGHLG